MDAKFLAVLWLNSRSEKTFLLFSDYSVTMSGEQQMMFGETSQQVVNQEFKTPAPRAPQAVAASPRPPQSCPMKFDFQDLQLLMKILDKAYRNGLFTAEESMVVTPFYSRIRSAFLSMSEQQ